jgi:hypothetical protein
MTSRLGHSRFCSTYSDRQIENFMHAIWAPHRGGAMGSRSCGSAVAFPAYEVNQVAECVEAAAELAGGCEDRAAVHLHSGIRVGI